MYGAIGGRLHELVGPVDAAARRRRADRSWWTGVATWPLGECQFDFRRRAETPLGTERLGPLGWSIWPLGECQLAFATESIRLVAHPQHPARHTHPSWPAATCQRSTRLERCRPSGPCARSAPSGRAGGRDSSNSGTASRCTSARDTPPTSSRRSETAATSCLTLQRLWHAHGCLTAARSNALRRHLAACSGAEARPRPGSYSWPELRQTAEAAFAAGNPAQAVIAALRGLHETGPAHPPSTRTMRRWHADRRWLGRAP